MHIVPAPAESLMKSRVLSIPGLQGVMDTGFSDFPGGIGAGTCIASKKQKLLDEHCLGLFENYLISPIFPY